jgi:MSHA biogenesis protein MshP
MYPSVRKQQGIGLIASIFLLVVVTIVVLALGNFTEISAQSFGQDLNSQRAFYAAEGGVEIALQRLSKPTPDACAGSLGSLDLSNEAGLTDCRVELSCTESTVATVTTWMITSTALCGRGFDQAQRAIKVQARAF